MADEDAANSYEEARRRRVQGIKMRFEEMGIREKVMDLKKLAKLLTSPAYSQGRVANKKSISVCSAGLRRSSRARNPVASYKFVPYPSRKSIYLAGSWTGPLERPLDEVRIASDEERAEAIQIAQEVEQNLQSSYPTFVKPMTLSFAYLSYTLSISGAFCDTHLPFRSLDMVLEDEKGKEYEVTFISRCLGSGWKSFALEHKLDDGDALVFELVEPTRFKVYIVRVGCQRGGKIEKDEMKEVADEDSRQMVKLKAEPQQDSKDESNMPKKPKIEAVRRSTRSTRSSSK